MADATQSAEARHRVRVFVDFWNFTLHVKDVDHAFRADWSRLGPVLSRAAAAIPSPRANIRD